MQYTFKCKLTDMNSNEIDNNFATDKVTWKSIFKLCFKLVYFLSAKKHNVVVF